MAAHRRVKHGTRAGYDKHRRIRAGNWKFPLAKEDPCGCQAAYRQYQRDVTAERGRHLSANQRSMARQRAYRRLQQLYGQDYAKFYAEELSIIQDGGKSVIGGLRQQLEAALVGVDEAQLARLIRHRMASAPESTRYYRILQLRQRIAEIESLVTAQRNPDGGS